MEVHRGQHYFNHIQLMFLNEFYGAHFPFVILVAVAHVKSHRNKRNLMLRKNNLKADRKKIQLASLMKVM